MSVVSNNRSEPLSKQLTIVVGLTVVGFMAFGLALSFYRNILFEQTLEGMEQQNAQIAERIEEGFADLEYYRSSQFRDKFAKENLNRVNPGEKTIILTQPSPSAVVIEADDEAGAAQREAAYLEVLNQMPVWEHWRYYLFAHDQLEVLKEQL